MSVTTDNIAVVIPQILTKYGSGKNCSIAGTFITAPSTAKISTSGQKLDVSLQVSIGVDNETAVFASIPNSVLDGILSSKDGKVFGNIATSQMGTIGSDF